MSQEARRLDEPPAADDPGVYDVDFALDGRVVETAARRELAIALGLELGHVVAARLPAGAVAGIDPRGAAPRAARGSP